MHRKQSLLRNKCKNQFNLWKTYVCIKKLPLSYIFLKNSENICPSNKIRKHCLIITILLLFRNVTARFNE